MTRQCMTALTPHHSDDLMEVYVGRVEPVTLCGYHAFGHGVQASLDHPREDVA